MLPQDERAGMGTDRETAGQLTSLKRNKTRERKAKPENRKQTKTQKRKPNKAIEQSGRTCRKRDERMRSATGEKSG